MSPKNAVERDGKRYYTWRGMRFPSVTTIIRLGVPKPALLPWGIKTTAEAAVRNRDLWLPTIGMGEEAAVAALKTIAYQQRDRAADVGLIVHLAAESMALGRAPEAPEELEPFLAQVGRFRSAYRPKAVLTERTVYNRRHGYAGTFDAILEIGGRNVLLDVKTGRDVYPEVALQLAAYRNAEFVGDADTGQETPLPRIDETAVLHLTDSNYRLLSVSSGTPVFHAFRAAIGVARFMEELGPRCIGEQIPVPVKVA